MTGKQPRKLYPEERRCALPTTEQVLRLFSHAERHMLSRAGHVVRSFEADFTPPQRQVLGLLDVPTTGFRGCRKFTEIASEICGKPVLPLKPSC